MSIDERKNFIPVRIGLLTVSDTRSLNDDKSGSTLSKRIESSGHQVVFRDIIEDDRQKIRYERQKAKNKEQG